MSPLAKVAHDHLALEHEVARIAARLNQGDVPEDHLTQLRAVFEAHLDDEEENLFPYLREHVPGVDDDIAGLIDEHARLRRRLDELDAAAAEGGEAVLTVFAAFRADYDAHTLREADFLATLIDELAPGDVMPG